MMLFIQGLRVPPTYLLTTFFPCITTTTDIAVIFPCWDLVSRMLVVGKYKLQIASTSSTSDLLSVICSFGAYC